ncbi:cytochrome P450 [Sorangium sp. So ce887]|uniref:cytochrome P450 n=1 Tax=Sorangium sp. So ce887 TaxID=3133324 RepID=UPI003F5E244C
MNQPINIFDTAFRANPYPYLAELRRASPVCQVEPGGMWAVTRYEDVLFVLKNPEVFSSGGFKVAWQPPWVGYNPMANSMLAMDPPAHTRLRGLIHRAFGASTVARLEPRVRAVAEDLASRLVGEVEFVDAFAMPLPAFVIGELLGMDHALRRNFKRWTDDILSITPAPHEDAERVRKTIADLTGYMREVIAARRRAPADDTVTDLLGAEVDGQRLTDTEVIDFLVLLLIGGLETTTHLLGNMMIYFAAHDGMMDRLRADPALIPLFVEEMLRYDGPVMALPRIATSEVSLSGVTVPAGALVLPFPASANRDEKKFPDPDRFDLNRGSQGGLHFGHGIHFCIGAALARMEARVALDVLLARFRRIERAAAEVQYNGAITVRGPAELFLRFVPASPSAARAAHAGAEREAAAPPPAR